MYKEFGRTAKCDKGQYNLTSSENYFALVLLLFQTTVVGMKPKYDPACLLADIRQNGKASEVPGLVSP